VKLRSKALLVFGSTMAGIVMIVLFSVGWILLPSFARLEMTHARRTVERMLGVINAEMESLQSLVQDWAAWDDTYRFVKDRNQDYITSNILDSTFKTLRLSLLLIVDTSGRRVFARAYDLAANKKMAVPRTLAPYLTGRRSLAGPLDVKGGIRGLIRLGDSLMLIVSWPILTSDDRGPVRGALMMGRYLDRGLIKRMARLAQAKTRIRLVGPGLDPERRRIVGLLAGGGKIHIRHRGDRFTTGYALLKDVKGRPAALLEIRTPRDIWRQGLRTVVYLLVFFSGTGVLVCLMMLIFLNNFLVSRVAKLGRELARIGRDGNISDRVEPSGKDELTHLAEEINQMLDALEGFQKQLRSLASEMSLAEERERHRIAVELHDRVGRNLFEAKLRLKALEGAAGQNLTAGLEQIGRAIDETIAETRSLTGELGTPILYDLGFEAALEWLAEKVETEHGLRVELVDDGRPKPLSEDLKVVLFRAVGELLHNAVKHALATRIEVSLVRQDDRIRVEIYDDGKGFDPQQLPSRTRRGGGIGLLSIRERLAHFGGQCEVYSQPGKGTVVKLTAPLARPDLDPGSGS
jgi:signal transduction histidine kinase